MLPGNTNLARQLDVLRCCATGGPQRFVDLRARFGLHASTLTRHLRALCALELLLVNADGCYAIAPGSTGLALDLLSWGADIAESVPAVDDLARQTGASAACWRLEGRRLILVAKHEVADGFHYIDRFAHRLPESSIFGLALLAALPEVQQTHHLRHATTAARRLLRSVGTDGLLVGNAPGESSWRVAAAVVCDGVAVACVGISRASAPAAEVAARDRRCVAAAARRLRGCL